MVEYFPNMCDAWVHSPIEKNKSGDFVSQYRLTMRWLNKIVGH